MFYFIYNYYIAFNVSDIFQCRHCIALRNVCNTLRDTLVYRKTKQKCIEKVVKLIVAGVSLRVHQFHEFICIAGEENTRLC